MHNHKKEQRYFLKLIWVAVVLASFTYSTVGFTASVIKSYLPNDWPDSRYIDHGDGTVTDNVTSLMWTKCLLGRSGTDCSDNVGVSTFSWKVALEEASSSTLAGYTDWRVPNYKELDSLVAHDRTDPGINENIFPNAGRDVWSSTPYTGNFHAGGVVSAWSVDFGWTIGHSYAVRDRGVYNRIYARFVRFIQ